MVARLAGTAEDGEPPFPARQNFNVPQSNGRESRHPQSRDSRRLPPGAKPAVIPPASPEVISNLITSLSAISQPANSHFESHPAAIDFALPSPSSPNSGSFGVEYGAFSRTKTPESAQTPTSLDNLAASPPIVRTSKPTSGYSPLTGPRSPENRSPTGDGSSALRSFLRSSGGASRPSSPGSNTSKNDDAQSIGNLSIERSAGPAHGLQHHRSHDSWGKKTGRSNKGVMYMSSKERLREKEFERKRLPGRSSDSSESYAGAASTMPTRGRVDPVLAEIAIREEPGPHDDAPATKDKASFSTRQPIPARDSSLRKSRAQRVRRSKRDSEVSTGDTILETEENTRRRNSDSATATRYPLRGGTAVAPQDRSFLLGPDEFATSPITLTYPGSPIRETNITSMDYDDDGAPSPAVAQRRRDDYGAEGGNSRISDRLSSGHKETLRVKRSSSRLKRLSGQLTPRSDSRSSYAASPDPLASQSMYPTGYERPASADSVDDAVESYLCSPRLSQKIQHPQTGRVISFSEVGDANGSAVFCCVGMGLTRYITAFYDELALTLKLRLITPDRPGVGDSEPYADGATTPLSWPDDVYAICQALKITKFSILAHSAGAIYALATALRMPQHIRGRLHLLAPWIPPSQMNVFGGSQALPPTNAIPTSQKILRALPTPLLKAANSSFMTATSSSITSSLPKNPRRTKRKSNTQGRDSNAASSRAVPAQEKESPGVAVPKRDKHEGHEDEPGLELPIMSENMDQIQPAGSLGLTTGPTLSETAADAVTEKERQVTYDTRLTHAIWELATTGANPAVDLLVCLERRHTIGFRYVDITRPVVIHHGSKDTRVPVENVKWLGKTMRRCEVRVLEGEGHGLMASATVMSSVLMEMSKEWEDWMRVTGTDGHKDRERGRRAMS